MRLILVLLGILWLALPARSEVARPTDPEVQAAIGDWLSGNETEALPALAGMAGQGNTAAQLLLAQIDSFPALQGDWLAGLSRAERIAVLRSAGGLSGVRWTKQGPLLDDPVAVAWVRLWDTAATPHVIVEFARLGEPRAARFAAMTLARRQRHGFAAVAEDPAYPASLRAYAVREGWRVPGSGIDPADPQRAVLGQVPDLAGFAAWADTAPEADAVVALCETMCVAEPPAICRPAALQALGGYWGLMPLGSPVEALVPSAVFNRSPRGIAATLRHMRGPADSACLTEALN